MQEPELHNHAIGLYQNGELWDLVLMAKQKSGLEISARRSVSDVKQLYNTLQELGRQSPMPCVVSALDTADLMQRVLRVPLSNRREVDEVLPFQLEPILPFSTEEAVITRYYLKQGDSESLLSALVTRKKHLSDHLEKLRACSVEPEIISCTPSALAAFAAHCNDNQDPLTVIHLGVDELCCIVANKGQVLACHHVDSGVARLLDNEAWGSEQEEEAVSLARRLALACLALNKEVRGELAEEILVCGPGVRNPKLVSMLLAKLHRPAASCQAPTWKNPSDGGHSLELAIPIGLALTAMCSTDSQINFRQGDFAYPRPWKRLATPMLTYFVLCAGIALSLLFAGQAKLRHSEAQVKQDYLELLATLHKSPEALEQEYQQKLSGASAKHDLSGFSVDQLSLSEIQDRATFLEESLVEASEGFPLQPNLPAVSDVLAWLSQHPQVVQDERSSKKALISVESFSYQMLKRPDKSRKNERYQVKVEIEFSTDNPTLAREFHDALIQANAVVDPKAEVKWSSNRGRYKTSFFVKDRTVYPRPNRGVVDV